MSFRKGSLIFSKNALSLRGGGRVQFSPFKVQMWALGLQIRFAHSSAGLGDLSAGLLVGKRKRKKEKKKKNKKKKKKKKKKKNKMKMKKKKMMFLNHAVR